VPAPVEPAQEPDSLPPLGATPPSAGGRTEERSTGPAIEPLPQPAEPDSKVIPPPVAPAGGEGTPPAPQAPTAPGAEETDKYRVRRPAYPVDSNVRLSQRQSSGTTPSTRYNVNRPALGSENLRQTTNILKGKVRSGDTGELEEGVQVILSSRTNAYADRVISTDAYGRYAVRLPNGDWTVKVVMPSGRAYVVSQLTISGNQIIDDLGRDVPSLTITR
jgi:hypothetical protein